MRLRRFADAEDGKSIKRLLPPPSAPAALQPGIEKEAPLQDALRPGIALPAGHEDEAHLRPGDQGLLHEPATAERFVIGMRGEKGSDPSRRTGGFAASSHFHPAVDQVGEQADEKHLHTGEREGDGEHAEVPGGIPVEESGVVDRAFDDACQDAGAPEGQRH